MFIFTAEPQSTDRITDFNPDTDALRFDRSYEGSIEVELQAFNTVLSYGNGVDNTLVIEWAHLSIDDIDVQWIGG